MHSVGIRHLKAHLSEYLRLANQGQCVLVTRHGADFVVLRAPEPDQQGLRRLLDSGMVSWSGRRPSGLHRSRPPA